MIEVQFGRQPQLGGSRMILVEPTLIMAVLLGSCLVTSPSGRFQQCLPDGTELTDVVSTTNVKPGSGLEPKKTTVEQKLIELKARCKKGKLVDGSGKEIRFYRLVGCWGNPPEDYQEILARQAAEIEKLRKRCTVVEMTCNPSSVQPY
jgi:hypothetical protein